MDESIPESSPGRCLYALAAVITTESQRAEAGKALRQMAKRDGVPFLHFADERTRGRAALAKRIADLEITGSIVTMQDCARRKQEACRERLMTRSLSLANGVERVTQVVIESRSQGNRRDIRTVDTMRAKQKLSGSEMRVEFSRKTEDPLLWIADCVAGAFTSFKKGGDPEPWEILNENHIIDVYYL